MEVKAGYTWHGDFILSSTKFPHILPGVPSSGDYVISENNIKVQVDYVTYSYNGQITIHLRSG